MEGVNYLYNYTGTTISEAYIIAILIYADKDDCCPDFMFEGVYCLTGNVEK